MTAPVSTPRHGLSFRSDDKEQLMFKQKHIATCKSFRIVSKILITVQLGLVWYWLTWQSAFGLIFCRYFIFLLCVLHSPLILLFFTGSRAEEQDHDSTISQLFPQTPKTKSLHTWSHQAARTLHSVSTKPTALPAVCFIGSNVQVGWLWIHKAVNYDWN
jgi:hypothetical protein